MRFSLKVFLTTLTITALSLGIGGNYFISALFNSALEREIKQSLDENNILRFAFETASLSVPTKYDKLQDITIAQIGEALEIDSNSASRYIRILSEGDVPIYTSINFSGNSVEPISVKENSKAYQVVEDDGRYFIQTTASMKALNRSLSLETFRNATPIFVERNNNYALFLQICAIILVVEAVVVYALSLWLTKPIQSLSRATKIMSGGSYDHRAKKISNDELGILTDDFNKMAESLESHIEKLRQEATAKEDFVAAFAHELKTPLTSIIGYSDLLRSYQVNEEQLFQSADYIFNEGKRLEALSFKLLDLIVLRRHEIQLSYIKASDIFEYLSEIYAGFQHINFQAEYDEAVLVAESSLIKTVMVNLVDNAVKATPTGGSVWVTGFIDHVNINMPGERDYVFSVGDSGKGIPEEELSRITEAFYMVDKSRTKSKEGAGVGLALCTEILKLHESALEFESILGEGTTVHFKLKCLYNSMQEEE